MQIRDSSQTIWGSSGWRAREASTTFDVRTARLLLLSQLETRIGLNRSGFGKFTLQEISGNFEPDFQTPPREFRLSYRIIYKNRIAVANTLTMAC